MKGQTRVCSVWLLLASGLVPVVALGQSNIDPDHKFAWGENLGWTNWRDANGAADGVVVGDTFFGGFIWAENAGWISVGDGSPGNGVHYGNDNGLDFGVNIDPSTGDLFGFAWGENIGWINFAGGALADPPQPARFDDVECRFRGFVWGENVGWINLDHVDHFVALEPDECECDPCDMDCDGEINAFDIEPFLGILFDGDIPCDACTGDANGDGKVDAFDIEPFLDCLFP